MVSIAIAVTAEHIAAAGPMPDADKPLPAEYRDPIERAIADRAGVDVDVSGDGDGVNAAGDYGFMATIGTTEPGSTLVVELPAAANDRANALWNGDTIEPFEFDIEIDPWLVDLIRDDRPYLTLREAAKELGVKPSTLRQQAQDEWNGQLGPSARARRLGVVKLGRDWFVDRVAVQREAAR